MEKFFKLKHYGTNVRTEIVAGFTTFFTMAYILIVNPSILANTGLDRGALFLATIFASAIGTLVMGLFANVPYALAPGMGLNAFFTFVVVFGLGFSPFEALGMVFICGVINILITVTRIRKHIVKSIPLSLHYIFFRYSYRKISEAYMCAELSHTLHNINLEVLQNKGDQA